MENRNVSTDDGPAGTAVSDPRAETSDAAETAERAADAEKDAEKTVSAERPQETGRAGETGETAAEAEENAESGGSGRSAESAGAGEPAETGRAAKTDESAKGAKGGRAADAAADAEESGGSEDPEGGEDGSAEEKDPAEDSAGGKAAGGKRSRLAWVRNPLVIALVLVVAGTALMVRAAQLRGSDAAQNRALTDVERTERVIGDVSNDIARIFSYTYADTATTEQAAREVLAGRAADQYRTLYAQVKQQAGKQRLTLTSRVVRAGVISMTDREARLLIFLDQTVRRRDKPAGTTAAAQLVVTARFADEQWRIVDIRAR